MNISKWGNKISDFLGKNKQEQTGVDKTLEEVNKTPEEMAKTPDLLLDKAFIKSPDSKDKVLDTKLDSLRLSTIFDDINQWLGIKETITPTDIESVSGLSWEKLNNLLTQYSVDIKTQGKEFIEAIKNVLDIAKRNEALVSQPEEIKQASASLERLRNLWKNSAVKYTFLTLMLLAKFTPEVKAGTTTDKPGDLQGQTKTEFNQKEVADNKENSLVYQVEPEDFKVESDLGDDPGIDSKKLPFEPVSKWLEFESNDSAFKSYAQFELSNYYLTDLADISPEYQQKISQQFSDFLAQINPDNFDQIMAHAWEISGSSDERPTKNWGGSNEELTKARINVAKNTLNSVIENYDFSSSGLTVEQIKYLQEKSIISKVYESGSGSEKGVKYITDLINPQTGDFYTPEEAGKLKGTALDAALQECRQISFNGLSLKLETLQKIPILTPELKEDKSIELRKTLTNWDQFEHVILTVDNSPSMTAAYQHMAEVISRQSELQKTKLKFGTFSDRLGKLSSSKVTEVTKFIAEMKKDGSSHERALHSTLEALRELPKAKTNEKNLIVVATDEPLQAINQELIDQLMSEAEAKNCQITFVYAHAREGKIARAISLEEVAVEYSKILWERLAPQIKYTLENEEARIKNLESTLKDIQQEINKLLDRDKLSKEQRKSLVQFQARKDIFEQQLDYSQLLKNELSKALASNDSAVLYEASKLTRRLNLKQISHISINPSGLGVDIALD